jgi:hypothetical protein
MYGGAGREAREGRVSRRGSCAYGRWRVVRGGRARSTRLLASESLMDATSIFSTGASAPSLCGVSRSVSDNGMSNSIAACGTCLGTRLL